MILTILIFLLVLSVLVVAHELGHYAMARWAGIDIEEFGIGFPPRIWFFTDKRGTKWSINLIPLGGFVKLKGEEDRNSPRGFMAQSKIKRALVLVAGVCMNLFLAMGLYSIIVWFGSPVIVDGDIPRFAQVVKEEMLILDVAPETSASKAGLPMGSTLLSINDIAVVNEQTTRTQLSELANNGQEAKIAVQINNDIETYTISPQVMNEGGKPVFGFYFTDATYIRYPFPVNIWIGIKTGIEYTVLIVFALFGLLWDLITGAGVQEAVSGPVGIAKMTGDVARVGLLALMQFAAMLSLNLAVLNILPFPALDGGRLFFLAVEAIRRKPVDEVFEARMHQFGFAFLMILVILVTYRDIARIF